MVIKIEHNNEAVEFESTGERTDSPDERCFAEFLEGYVNGQKKYEAVGIFELGSDNFIEITDIEVSEVESFNLSFNLNRFSQN